MLSVLSPAKTLDYENPACIKTFSEPDFLDDSQELIKTLRKMSPDEISNLMSISEKLSVLNVDRYKAWDRSFTEENAKQALLAFKGDVYTGLDVDQFSKPDFNFAQNHLRILSGLYGLLRPLDLMQPYRLEMGTGLQTKRGKNLYEFWGEQVTHGLNQAIKEGKSKYLVNLASNEYYKAVKPNLLEADVITPCFKDWKKDQYKIVSFYAKKARGAMAAHMVLKRAMKPEDIQDFNWGGYAYNEELSTPTDPMFTRKEPA